MMPRLEFDNKTGLITTTSLMAMYKYYCSKSDFETANKYYFLVQIRRKEEFKRKLHKCLLIFALIAIVIAGVIAWRL